MSDQWKRHFQSNLLRFFSLVMLHSEAIGRPDAEIAVWLEDDPDTKKILIAFDPRRGGFREPKKIPGMIEFAKKIFKLADEMLGGRFSIQSDMKTSFNSESTTEIFCLAVERNVTPDIYFHLDNVFERASQMASCHLLQKFADKHPKDFNAFMDEVQEELVNKIDLPFNSKWLVDFYFESTNRSSKANECARIAETQRCIIIPSQLKIRQP
jgi:hypothetical protein